MAAGHLLAWRWAAVVNLGPAAVTFAAALALAPLMARPDCPGFLHPVAFAPAPAMVTSKRSPVLSLVLTSPTATPISAAAVSRPASTRAAMEAGRL
jgi:hypothetical protein